MAEGTQQLVTYVPRQVAERMKALAEASYRSVAAEARIALEAHIAAQERKPEDLAA